MKKTYQLTDMSAWLTGGYVRIAIGSFLDKDMSYPRNAIFFAEEISEEEKERLVDENTQIAAIKFGAWANVKNKTMRQVIEKNGRE